MEDKRDFRKKKRNSGKSSRKGGSSKKDARGYTSKEARFDEEANRGNTKASNHVEWYGGNSVLMQQAARLPFFETAGLPYNLGNGFGSADSKEVVNPGIMNLYMMTTPGTCTDWSSPVNVAIRDMYSYIRHQNSGSKNYDAANLGMYLMAYDACVTYFAWMVRTYGVARMVLLRNRYTPEILLDCAGVNYNSLVKNLAQFCSYINTYAARLSVMRVPSNFHVFERHMWIYSNVFADAPVDKAQMYLFQPHRFWKYTLGDTPETTGLFPAYPGEKDEKTTNFKCNFEDIVDFGEELLNSILNDEDFNIMSGDILKAYGSNVFTLSMISPEYLVNPVYDPEVLLQIHNATVFDHRYLYHGNEDVIDIDAWSITENYTETEDVGALVFNAPIELESNTYANLRKILDMPVSDPTPELVCIATRLMTQVVIDANGKAKFDSYGTEIIVGADIVTNESVVGEWKGSKYEYCNLTDEANRACFANRPYVVQLFGSVMKPLGPFDNYTVLDATTIYNIHRAALLGMYGFAK